MVRRLVRVVAAAAMLAVPLGFVGGNEPATASTCISASCLPVGGGLTLGSGGLPVDSGYFHADFSWINPDATSWIGWINGYGTTSDGSFTGSGTLNTYNYSNYTGGFSTPVSISATFSPSAVPAFTGVVTVQSTGAIPFVGAWVISGGNTNFFQFGGVSVAGA